MELAEYPYVNVLIWGKRVLSYKIKSNISGTGGIVLFFLGLTVCNYSRWLGTSIFVIGGLLIIYGWLVYSDPDNETSELVLAAGKGDNKYVSWLITQGCTDKAILSRGLMAACEKGHLETSHNLLLAGADPNWGMASKALGWVKSDIERYRDGGHHKDVDNLEQLASLLYEYGAKE